MTQFDLATQASLNTLTAKVTALQNGLADLTAQHNSLVAEVVTDENRIKALEAVPPPVVVPPTVTAPGVVTNLAVVSTTAASVTLSFTEVTDGTGQSAHYEIRYAVGSISWGSSSLGPLLAGGVIGALRTVTVIGLNPSTDYQFQLVAYRGTLNIDAVFGDLSNVVGATTSSGVVIPPPPPPPSGAVWPNAPTSWITVFDSDLNTIPGGGWNTSGPKLINDSTAPLSPPGVAEYLYPQGKQGGAGVGSLWRSWPSGMDSHYIGYYFKLSNPFDNRFGFKQWYPGPNGPGYYFMVVEGAAAPPYDLRIEGPVGQTNNFSNVQRAQVQVGVWHRLEILFEGGSRLRWWLDNVLCGDHPISWHIVGVAEARLDSTWGGVNNTVAFTSKWWADHIFMSRP